MAQSATVDVASQTGRTLLNLREMLLRGDFQAGERISELPLVARLGVSRTPIRLALDRLAHEGLLESVPTGGFGTVVIVSPLFMTHGDCGLSPVPLPNAPFCVIVGFVLQAGNFTCGFGNSEASTMLLGALPL